MKIITTEIYL